MLGMNVKKGNKMKVFRTGFRQRLSDGYEYRGDCLVVCEFEKTAIQLTRERFPSIDLDRIHAEELDTTISSFEVLESVAKIE